MTETILRPRTQIDTHQFHNPRDDWPTEAQQLYHELCEFYPEDDPLPITAGAWCARQKSQNTRIGYARGYKRWDRYARSSDWHPFHATLALADAYSNHLASVLTSRRGGSPKPLADASRANYLSAPSSFYDYAVIAGYVQRNPFKGVSRPNINQDYSPTTGFTEKELGQLFTTAKDYSLRSFALVLLLYYTGSRIDELLSADIETMGYDRGFSILTLVLKGNKKKSVPMPPPVFHIITLYIGERTRGPIFITRTGCRWTKDQVWKHLRFLARLAGIPQASVMKPHMFRHQFITDALDNNIPLEIVQDAVGHSDPRTTQRYNRRRNQLERHPAHVLAARGIPGIS